MGRHAAGCGGQLKKKRARHRLSAGGLDASDYRNLALRWHTLMGSAQQSNSFRQSHHRMNNLGVPLMCNV